MYFLFGWALNASLMEHLAPLRPLPPVPAPAPALGDGVALAVGVTTTVGVATIALADLETILVTIDVGTGTTEGLLEEIGGAGAAPDLSSMHCEYQGLDSVHFHPDWQVLSPVYV
jgi:hypothetical protein